MARGEGVVRKRESRKVAVRTGGAAAGRVAQRDQQAILLSKAQRALAEARTVPEIEDLANKAEAVRHYIKTAGLGLDLQNQAAVLKLRAERKGGELLAGMEKHPGGGDHRLHAATSGPATLKELGLEKTRAHRWQRLAALPKGVFETYITETTEALQEITSAALFRILRRYLHGDRHRKALGAARTGGGDRWTVTEDQSVVPCVAVITDPPYGILDEDWEPADLENFTRGWLTRWAGAGADVVLAFWSQRYLWEGKRWFDESLQGYTFQQLLVWHCPNNKSPQSRRGFKQTWEPVFFYRRSACQRQVRIGSSDWGKDLHDFDCHVAAVPQSNFNGVDYKVHPAQKPSSVMRWLVNAVTEPGDLVCDPFAGSGTTGVAAVQLERRFHGVETDPAFQVLARQRIGAYADA